MSNRYRFKLCTRARKAVWVRERERTRRWTSGKVRIQSWGGAGLPFRGVFAGDPRHSAKVGAVGAITLTCPEGEISRRGEPRSGDDAAIEDGGDGGASASALFMARSTWSR